MGQFYYASYNNLQWYLNREENWWHHENQMCEVMGLFRIFRKNKIFKALYLTKVLLVQIGEEI